MNEEYQRRLQEINARIDRLNAGSSKTKDFDVQRANRTGQTIANAPDYSKTIERLEANKKARQEPINPREPISTEKEVQREWGWKMERHGKAALNPTADGDIAMKLNATGHHLKDIETALDKHSPYLAKVEAEHGKDAKNIHLANSLDAPYKEIQEYDGGAKYRELCQNMEEHRKLHGLDKQRLEDVNLSERYQPRTRNIENELQRQ